MNDGGQSLVFTPVEASAAGEEYVEFRQSNEGGGMPLYIPSMEYSSKTRKGFMPVLLSETISVIGRPGHGKTGKMLRWARMRAKDLQKRGEKGDELASKSVVVFISLEQKVEELRLFHVAAEEKISMSDIASGKIEKWDDVKLGLRKLHPVPIWFIGRSMKRRKSKIEMSEQNIYSGLESIERWQDDNQTQIVDSVFIDYLQKFRAPSHEGMVEFYGNLMNTFTKWGSDFMTRMIIGIQAKRDVDRRDPPIPLMEDGQWTSTIEQFSDGVLSLVRPCLYPQYKEGSFEGVAVQGSDQLLITCLKRKLGPANFNGWVKFEPEYNQLNDLEVRSYNMRLNKGLDE